MSHSVRKFIQRVVIILNEKNINIENQALALFVVFLLIALSFLSMQFSFKMTAAVEYASLADDGNDEELEPARVFQTPTEATKLYLFEGRMIWVSSYYYPPSSTVTVVQEQESGDPVTISADYYLTADHTLFCIQ